MNDLLKEASKQTILEAISFMWLGYNIKKMKEMHRAKLDETRQLKRPGAYYLTGLEPSGVVLEDYDWNLMPFKWRNKSNLDLDQFKADCKEIDHG